MSLCPHDAAPHPLWSALDRALTDVASAGEAPHAVAVACSGGRDSMALLHAAVRWSETARRTGEAGVAAVQVVAFHVHHGLSAAADAWLDHVRQWVDGLQSPHVRFLSRKVRVEVGAGDSLEECARQARYRALAEMAAEAGVSVVLLAHHLDDQAETFLLQALRGAGPRGLASMPDRLRRDGVLWLRPWLDLRRAHIEAYVAAHGIAHVEDDSNSDRRFARNHLRLDVMPLLSAMGGAPMLARSARLAQDAATCLADLAEADLTGIRSGSGLDVPALHRLSPARRRQVLHHWLSRELSVRARYADVCRLAEESGPDRSVGSWSLGAFGTVHQYRGRLIWSPREFGASSDEARARSDVGLLAMLPFWRPDMAISLLGVHDTPDQKGRLEIQSAAPGGPCVPLEVLRAASWRPRQGGETFQMAPASMPRSLRKQFQARGVPEWQRSAWVLWSGGRVLWVPGLGLDARRWSAHCSGDCVGLQWNPPQGA